MIRRSDIQMRDPYVFVENGLYYLYGTTDPDCWHGAPVGFDVYIGDTLESFEYAGRAFAPSPGFWGTQNFWAPELHKYRGMYYLFASFKAPDRRRATSILRSPSPTGPFALFGDDSVTPPEWECLDGTLHVDTAGDPWVVFCHEWVQPGGGTVCARRLKADLSGAAGDPVTLFHASDAPWSNRVRHSSGIEGYVTDGPSMVYPAKGGLLMLWSSLCETGYAIGLAVSDNGNVLGPWRQQDKAVFSGDGGHGMVFRGLDGALRLAIHTPNKTPNERPVFLPVRETEEGLELA